VCVCVRDAVHADGISHALCCSLHIWITISPHQQLHCVEPTCKVGFHDNGPIHPMTMYLTTPTQTPHYNYDNTAIRAGQSEECMGGGLLSIPLFSYSKQTSDDDRVSRLSVPELSCSFRENSEDWEGFACETVSH